VRALGALLCLLALPGSSYSSPARVSTLARTGLLADPYVDPDFNPAYINFVDGTVAFLGCSLERTDSTDEYRRHSSTGAEEYQDTETETRRYVSPDVGLVLGGLGPMAFGFKYWADRWEIRDYTATVDSLAGTGDTNDNRNRNSTPYALTVYLGASVGETLSVGVSLFANRHDFQYDYRYTSASSPGFDMEDHVDEDQSAAGGELGLTVSPWSASRLGGYFSMARNRRDRHEEDFFGTGPAWTHGWDITVEHATGGLTFETDPTRSVHLRSFVEVMSTNRPDYIHMQSSNPNTVERQIAYTDVNATCGIGVAIRHGESVLLIPSLFAQVIRHRDDYSYDSDTTTPGTYDLDAYSFNGVALSMKLGLENSFLNDLLVTRLSVFPVTWHHDSSYQMDADETGTTEWTGNHGSSSFSVFGSWVALDLGINISRALTADLQVTDGYYTDSYDSTGKTMWGSSSGNVGRHRGLTVDAGLTYRWGGTRPGPDRPVTPPQEPASPPAPADQREPSDLHPRQSPANDGLGMPGDKP